MNDGHGLSESSDASKLAVARTLRSAGGRIEALVAASAAHLKPGARFAEVGYDRGAIVLRVLEARPDTRAIASEIQPGVVPLPAPGDVLSRLELRTGDGLAPIAAHEVSLVIMAGMGGRTIAELITRNPELTRSLDTLVLCPSHLEAEIRPALTSIGYAPTHERLAFERDRFYEVIVAQRVTAPISPVDPIRAAWGPRLFEHHDPLLRAFLEDAKRRFHAAFKEDLRSYLTSELKAALGHKLATLDAALALI